MTYLSCLNFRELERRAFTKTQCSVHVPLKMKQEQTTSKIEKSTSHVACSKQHQIVYDLTVDRTGRYQEESRRGQQEGIEVALFTAKHGSDRETWYSKGHLKSQKQRDTERERDAHLFSQSVPVCLQSAQPSPTLTQSSYYSPASDSLEYKTSVRRDPASQELYEQLSVPNAVASSLHLPSTQNALKARPPPLIKYKKDEGLLVKITEQLVSKAISAEALELRSDRKSCHTSLIPGSTSLHRAPIFHPPALPITASKVAGRNRLSPPTLSPIQPISLSGKGQDVHRPPTLIPELRHGTVAGKSVAPDPVCMTSQAHHLHRGKTLHTHDESMMGRPVTNGVEVNTQTATASVIVRPASYTHPPSNHSKTVTSPSQSLCGHVQAFKKESNTHLRDGQCKRAVFWTPIDTVHHNNTITSEQVNNMPLNMTIKNTGTKNIVSNHTSETCHFSDMVPGQCENNEAGFKVLSKVDSSLTSCCFFKGLPHVKKHRAGLAASRSRQSMQPVQFLHTTGTLNSVNNVCHASHSSTNSLHTHTSDQNKQSVFSPSPPKHPRLSPKIHGVVANKPSAQSQPPVHINQPAQSSQNNYHKLKKAWLTRHSEQDRGSSSFETAKDSLTVGASLPNKHEVNGFENKWSMQEGKGSSQDNIKSKTLDRMNVSEGRNCRESIKSNTDDKKLASERVNSLSEDVKPVLDRDGSFVNKKNTSTQNKKHCINDRLTNLNPADFKIEKDRNGENMFPSESCQNKNHSVLSNDCESRKCESTSKHQNKTTFTKRQNGQRTRRWSEKDEEEEESEGKSNGTHRSTKEKSQHRLPNSESTLF